MKKKRYTARYTLEDGDWLVEIDEIPQVHTFGRTLARAQDNIRDALALWLQADDPSVLEPAGGLDEVEVRACPGCQVDDRLRQETDH